MEFKSYKDWVKGVIVLYPGGFRPATGGHLDLIKRYCEREDVREVRILISPSSRDGISSRTSAEILRYLTAEMPKVKVIESQWPSPVLAAYKEVEASPLGVFALAASTKGEDFSRSDNFVRNLSPGGRQWSSGKHAINLEIDHKPLVFQGRLDEWEGLPISASILREDHKRGDFGSFKTGWPLNSEKDALFIWKKLSLNEALYIGRGGSSSPSGIDRSQPGYYYRSSFPIADSIEEGGAGGHLKSPWEAKDLTFMDLREMISKALSGSLENVSEKLDGQNIMVSFWGGKTYIARTPKQMKNPEEAIPWDEIYDYFGESTPREVKDAYANAAEDFHNAFLSSKIPLDPIFKGGAIWINVELLNPSTENIIPYGERRLRIHNLKEIKDGEERTLFNGELDKIVKEIQRAQREEIMDHTHLISRTNPVSFRKIEGIKGIEKEAFERLNKIIKDSGLDNGRTIGDYLEIGIRRDIDKKDTEGRIREEVKENLIKRWVWGDKSKNIAKVLKETPSSFSDWVREEDKKIPAKMGELLEPLINLFSWMSIKVLKNLDGIASSNPDEASQKIRKKLEEAIQKIEEFIKRGEMEEIKDFEKKTAFIETQLKRLKEIDGFEEVLPIEGIVFEYKGELYKLTGSYLPILKIIGFFTFGGDK